MEQLDRRLVAAQKRISLLESALLESFSIYEARCYHPHMDRQVLSAPEYEQWVNRRLMESKRVELGEMNAGSALQK